MTGKEGVKKRKSRGKVGVKSGQKSGQKSRQNRGNRRGADRKIGLEFSANDPQVVC